MITWDVAKKIVSLYERLSDVDKCLALLPNDGACVGVVGTVSFWDVECEVPAIRLWRVLWSYKDELTAEISSLGGDCLSDDRQE
jgi:hypothetical protein